MNSLCIYEFPKLVTKMEYDEELEVYTLHLYAEENKMVLILTPAQLSQVADTMLESVGAAVDSTAS